LALEGVYPRGAIPRSRRLGTRNPAGAPGQLARAIGSPILAYAIKRYLELPRSHRSSNAANDARGGFDNYVPDCTKLANAELA
jgi:hypothetical protein